MEPQLPGKNEIREQAEASALAAAETDVTGFGPIKGGTAATAQSARDRRQNFIAAAGDVARKPARDITMEDAAAVQSAESRALGGRPPKGSASATAQALAAENEKKRQTQV
ncbi:hypothetical protein LX36DRAFT_753600 [Colletotrichum falcatum]|nr:hypothetical protein LX36DRAFT_753600 [Colletotrichum falcatum]